VSVWFLFLFAFVTATATAALVTPRIRRIAEKAGFVDQIDDRRMHVEPKPRAGGLAIYLGFLFALFVSIGLALKLSPTLFHRADDIHDVLGLLFGGTMIVIVGLWDDIMGMRARDKLIAQIVVAAVSMSYGFIVSGFEVPFWHVYVNVPLWLGVPLTLLWYLGMMNAINFLDGLDGLLTGVTAISGLFLFAIAVGHGHLVPALALSALVGGALGFLPYNFNPSKIILGDTGSLFIGYVFATVSIIVTAKVAITVSLLVPLIALAFPVVDAALAIWRRLRAGKSIATADRGHLHHILVFRFGLNVRQAVLLIYAVSFALGAVAYVLSGGLAHVRIAGI
jgi:UDP-GlcNAc:undecaprenyl-phosphate/decaprenyl-phosphate GlcNAc-1-phosphate transferase